MAWHWKPAIAFLKAQLKSWLVNLVLNVAKLRLATHDILFVNCCHGEYVASYRLASPVVLLKASRKNFSASEIAILTEKVEENLFIIQSKLTNTVIQTKKKMKYGVKLRRLSTPKELHRGRLPRSEKNGKIYTHKPKKSSQNWPKSRKKLDEVRLRGYRGRQ